MQKISLFNQLNERESISKSFSPSHRKSRSPRIMRSKKSTDFLHPSKKSFHRKPIIKSKDDLNNLTKEELFDVKNK